MTGSAAKGDKEAAWVKHRTRPPAHGYKAHIAAGKDSGIIRDVETTAANEPDVAFRIVRVRRFWTSRSPRSSAAAR